MKKTILLLLLFPALVCSAQWNNDVSENLNISGQANSRAPLQTIKTTDGKTWIAFYKQSAVTGNYDMWVQLLDKNGIKLLSDTGSLVSNLPAGGNTSSFFICIDSVNNLVIGFDYYAHKTNKAVVFKVDQTGKNLWGKKGITLGEGLSPYPASLSNGQVIVVWSKSDYGLQMQKIKNSGEVAWDSAISIKADNYKLTNGQPVPNLNGTFTVIMQQVVYPPYVFFYAMRYNTNGKALWKSAVQLNSVSSQTFNPFSSQAEKDTMYVGYTYSSLTQVGYLQRINPDGSLPYGINGSNFAFDTTSYQQRAVYIATDNNTPYIWAVCEYTDLDQNRHGIKVQKFSKTDGKRLFSNNARLVSPIGFGGNTPISPVAVTGNGNLIFTYHDTACRYSAASLNRAGITRWIKPVRLSTTKQLYILDKIFETFTYNNKQGVLVWQEDRGNGYNFYAQNIRNDGTTGNNTVPILDEPQTDNALVNNNAISLNKLTISPNPVKDLLTVTVKAQNNFTGNISITNSSGKLLLHKPVQAIKGAFIQQIDVSSFAEGIYFLTVTSADEKIKLEKTFVK